jgi:hypothetical protein
VSETDVEGTSVQEIETLVGWALIEIELALASE